MGGEVDAGRVGTLGQKYVLSVGAACVAEFVTFPLDLVKTRLQMQGEGMKMMGTPYRGMVMTGLGVMKEEGVTKLWQGITPGVARHVVYSGVRMTLYDLLRTKVQQGRKKMGLLERAMLGMVSGGLGQLVASPADLVKVRMQMEGRRKLQGLPVRVTSMRAALVQAVREGGVRALWAGAVPNVQRAALVNLGDLTTYDHAKSYLVSEGWADDRWTTHAVSSGCAGLAAATMGTPADVVKARVMNQPLDKAGRGMYYRGAVDCLMQAVRTEGFFSLYKGFVPCWLRMAPWSLTFWISFEKLRTLARLDPW